MNRIVIFLTTFSLLSFVAGACELSEQQMRKWKKFQVEVPVHAMSAKSWFEELVKRNPLLPLSSKDIPESAKMHFQKPEGVFLREESPMLMPGDQFLKQLSEMSGYHLNLQGHKLFVIWRQAHEQRMLIAKGDSRELPAGNYTQPLRVEGTLTLLDREYQFGAVDVVGTLILDNLDVVRMDKLNVDGRVVLKNRNQVVVGDVDVQGELVMSEWAECTFRDLNIRGQVTLDGANVMKLENLILSEGSILMNGTSSLVVSGISGGN